MVFSFSIVRWTSWVSEKNVIYKPFLKCSRLVTLRLKVFASLQSLQWQSILANPVSSVFKAVSKVNPNWNLKFICWQRIICLFTMQRMKFKKILLSKNDEFFVIYKKCRNLTNLGQIWHFNALQISFVCNKMSQTLTSTTSIVYIFTCMMKTWLLKRLLHHFNVFWLYTQEKYQIKL